MGSGFQIVSGNSTFVSGTDYLLLGGSIGQGKTSSETKAKITMRSAGTFANYLANVSANSSSITITFRKNGANGNQTVTTSGTGQIQDSTHSDAVVAGDLVNHTIITGTPTMQSVSTIFVATTNTVTKMTNTGSSTAYTFSNSTIFFTLGGRTESASTTTESNTKCRQQKVGTMQNLCVNIAGNSRAEIDTCVDRLNGANGNLTASITSSTNGNFEDTTHTTTIAAGNDYDLGIVLGSSTSSQTCDGIGVEFVTTSSVTQVCNSITSGVAFGSGTTQKLYLGGELQTNTTESKAQDTTRIAYTFSNITTNITVNTSTSNGTLVYRAGGVSGNQSITITSNTTGVFADTIHTDVAAITDLVNYQFATGATNATTAIHISMWGTTSGLTTYAVSETITLTETSIIRKITRKIAETLALAEAIKRKAIRVLSEALVLAETTIKRKITRKLAETLSLAETKSALKFAAGVKHISETLRLAETTLVRKFKPVIGTSIWIVSITEVVSLAEVVKRKPNRHVMEYLRMPQSNLMRNFMTHIPENLSLIESKVTKLPIRAAFETLNLAETTIRKRTIKQISEFITLTENRTHRFPSHGIFRDSRLGKWIVRRIVRIAPAEEEEQEEDTSSKEEPK